MVYSSVAGRSICSFILRALVGLCNNSQWGFQSWLLFSCVVYNIILWTLVVHAAEHNTLHIFTTLGVMWTVVLHSAEHSTLPIVTTLGVMWTVGIAACQVKVAMYTVIRGVPCVAQCCIAIRGSTGCCPVLHCHQVLPSVTLPSEGVPGVAQCYIATRCCPVLHCHQREYQVLLSVTLSSEEYQVLPSVTMSSEGVSGVAQCYNVIRGVPGVASP